MKRKQAALRVEKKQVVPRVHTTTSKHNQHDCTQPNIIEDDWQSIALIRKREPNMSPRPHQILVPTAKMSGPFIISPDNSEDFDAYEQRCAHWYPTRRKTHMANCLSTINAKICKQMFMFNAENKPYDEYMANAIVDEENGRAMKYRDLIKNSKYMDDWKHSFSNEIGQLAQGLKRGINRTSTILFVMHDKILEDRKRDATYGRIVCDYRPQKEEKN